MFYDNKWMKYTSVHIFSQDSYGLTMHQSQYLFAVLVTVGRLIVVIAIAATLDCCLSVALRVAIAAVRE